MTDARSLLWSALERGDRVAALDVVKGEVACGRTATDVIGELVVPAQALIGDLWLAGTWDVDREHAATAINEGLVQWLGSFAPPPDPGSPRVVVACLERERHSLPALVVAEGLAWQGYDVTYLGGDPDPDELVREVMRLRPRAVLFSASLTSSLAGQKRFLAELHSMGLPVIVGGSAFGGDPARAEALGATAYAADLPAAVRLLETLPTRVAAVQVPDRTPADVDADWILEQRHVLADGIITRLLDRLGHPGALPAWWDDLAGHVHHVVGGLAASVALGDETIVVELRDWLNQVVAARGGDPAVVAELWTLLAVPLRGHPLARIHLAAAAAAPVTPVAAVAAPVPAPVPAPVVLAGPDPGTAVPA